MTLAGLQPIYFGGKVVCRCSKVKKIKPYVKFFNIKKQNIYSLIIDSAQMVDNESLVLLSTTILTPFPAYRLHYSASNFKKRIIQSF